MVLIKLDSNSILVEPMRDRTSGEMIQAYQVLVDRPKKKGFNRRPVKGLYIGPPYFNQFFPMVVTYVWYSGMKLA